MKTFTLNRYLKTAAATAILGICGIAGFFLYCDAWVGFQDSLYELNAIAEELEDDGKLPEAEALYRKVLDIQEARSVTYAELIVYPGMLATRNDLAMLLMNQNRLAEAEREFNRLLADVMRATVNVGVHAAYSAIFSSNYGECLRRAGKYPQARTLLESAQPLLVESLGADHEWVQKNADRLKQVSSALKVN